MAETIEDRTGELGERIVLLSDRLRRIAELLEWHCDSKGDWHDYDAARVRDCECCRAVGLALGGQP